ncbi:OmpH family outer membrane protein [Oscillatoria amoena NRMC-F 0135]|nr:OmpH family outer membrane protein [Oscillatoria amoena NRMC-F 0135]|eukprot:gene101-147_t
MKNSIKTLALVFGLMICAITANAQSKIAHIYADSLVLLMPEAQKADTVIQAEVKTWENALSKREAELKNLYDSIMKKVADNGGEEPKNDPFFQILVDDYQAGTQKFNKLDQDAKNAVAAKRQTLYEPIIAKVRKAIEEVAKEKGYTYVLDASAGGILYSQPADNLMNDVKKKLGLK